MTLCSGRRFTSRAGPIRDGKSPGQNGELGHLLTWRANSAYAGYQDNRAGERYMRLRLFDRICRLARFRSLPADPASAVSGAQGRHRRGSPREPATAPGALSFPVGQGSSGGPPGELTHTAAPWPAAPPAAETPFTPVPPAARTDLAGPRPDRRAPGTHRSAGESAARAGGARVRIREAPPDAAAVGVGGATRPAPAASAPQAR